MLDVKTRQSYLKKLGFYDGEVNGKENKETKAAYLKLQKKYFIRKSDQDGIYGSNTDKLLLDAMRVKKRTKNFELEEFKCECGGSHCTGYPAYLSIDLLEGLQKVRDKYKKPITITSGMRCKGYNAQLGGSISNSRHMSGKAVDFYIPGKTTTETGRISVMNFLKKLKGHNFTYCFLPTKYRTQQEKTASYMGDAGGAVHWDVK